MTHAMNLRGVHVERRALLYLPLVAALPAAARPRDDDAEGRLDFADFSQRCEALAARHLEGGRVDADVYLHGLAALGARLDAADVPRPDLNPFGTYDPPIGISPVHRALPVMVILWRLDPGAVLPPHNHTPGYVYSLCLEGACRVRHFEIVGQAPTPGAEGRFRMRETLAKLLRPGLGSSLTPDRDNVHTFVAGSEGALGIDVNTFLPGEGDWSMIECEEREREGFEKLLQARWIGKPG